MSKSMKTMLAGAGALLLIALVLTAFGKPPNLPIPGLQGVLAGEEEIVADDATATPVPDCGTAGGLGTTDPGAATTDPAATPGVDPATGAPASTDPAAVDPATGAAVPADPAAAPADGTVTGAPADGFSGSSRVVAAGDGGSWSRVTDASIVAADAVTDPAAAPAAGATDP
ncbi:MAG: hypothetical protein JWM90_1647, partial [Thermoleophilia bacterium]|nr:hypothetical protein [Thermoleophilia bacterium]